MAGVRNRAHFTEAIRSLTAKGLIRERKSGATKEGNSFWLTAAGLNAACVMLGLMTLLDAEWIVGLVAFLQVEHEPCYSHSWVSEQALAQQMNDFSLGQIQMSLLPPSITGIIETNSDLLGRVSYRVPDRVLTWMREMSEHYFATNKLDGPLDIDALGNELGIKILLVDDDVDVEPDHFATLMFRLYLSRYFTLACLDEYERVPEDRPPHLETDIWGIVDRAKDNIRAAAASMPPGEVGAIPLQAHGSMRC